MSVIINKNGGGHEHVKQFDNSSRIFRGMQLSTDVQMCTFVSRVNRITGQMEWDFREDDYDYKQEIAR